MDRRRAVYVTFDAIFEDGAYRWGRIVRWYFFSAGLAKYCQTQAKDKIVVENWGTCAGDCMAYHLKHWIQEYPMKTLTW